MTVRRRTLLSTALAALLPAGLARAAEPESKASHRIAVVFFSRTGNTRSVAESIQNFTGADIFEVETEEPYPEEYREATRVVKHEIDKGIRRPVKPLAIDLSKYDTVILGTPTWWGRPAQPLKTWMETVDLSDKFVLTYNSHNTGGVMQTRFQFVMMLPGVRMGTHFSTWLGVRKGSSGVRDWLAENGLV